MILIVCQEPVTIGGITYQPGELQWRSPLLAGDPAWEPPLERCLDIAGRQWGVAPGTLLHARLEDQALMTSDLTVSLAEGRITGVAAQASPPAAPASDPIAQLKQAVERNLAASPHDRRFLTQKAIGKQIIPWIKANPACTPDQAEAHIMALVQAELPGQPVVPKLYWEHGDEPQGLAMSYLYEAVRRGYLPPGTPLTWDSLKALIVATPEAQIAAWLRTL